MNTQRGMSTGLIVGIIVVLALLAGGWYYMQPKSSGDAMESTEMMEGDAMDKDDAMMGTESGAMMDDSAHMEDGTMVEGDAMMKTDGDTMMETKTETSFNSAVIAGSSAPLLEFDQRDYEAATKSGRLVVLYFYANWCPICKAEFADAVKPAFNSYSGDDVVGFRVHFNDDAVTPEMEALAREFGVAYQHTKVFIKGGERVLKSPESWDKDRYLREFAIYTN